MTNKSIIASQSGTTTTVTDDKNYGSNTNEIHMTPDIKIKLIKICDMVADDTENDAVNFDGQPFNGKTVATYFGNHGAAIAALSDVLKKILNNTETSDAVTTVVTEYP